MIRLERGPAKATLKASESDSPQSKDSVAPNGVSEKESGLKPSFLATKICAVS